MVSDRAVVVNFQVCFSFCIILDELATCKQTKQNILFDSEVVQEVNIPWILAQTNIVKNNFREFSISNVCNCSIKSKLWYVIYNYYEKGCQVKYNFYNYNYNYN